MPAVQSRRSERRSSREQNGRRREGPCSRRPRQWSLGHARPVPCRDRHRRMPRQRGGHRLSGRGGSQPHWQRDTLRGGEFSRQRSRRRPFWQLRSEWGSGGWEGVRGGRGEWGECSVKWMGGRGAGGKWGIDLSPCEQVRTMLPISACFQLDSYS